MDDQLKIMGDVNGAGGRPVAETILGVADAKTSHVVVMSFAGQVMVTKAGIVFPRGLAQHVWEEIGIRLQAASNSSAWWLADWLIFGETAYSGRYREAIKRTGLDYQTLRNYAWIARKFPHERRVEGLSIAHHAEVARLTPPEQDYWLRKARNEQWSRNRLRREVRASLAEREGAEWNPPGPSRSVAPAKAAAAIEVHLAPEQLDLCERVADSYGMSLGEWVANLLRSATQDFAPEAFAAAE